LEFYEREGFAVTGGRKLKVALWSGRLSLSQLDFIFSIRY
jgi:hypothetical protein